MKLEFQHFINNDMKNKITVDGFDPSRFNVMKHGYMGKWKKLKRWVNKGYVLPPGRPFKNNKEAHKVIQLIKTLDPMLAHICLLSYKYVKHPVYEIAVARPFSEQVLRIGGLARKFPSSTLEIDELEWFLVKPYTSSVSSNEMVFIMNPSNDVWLEIEDRWSNIVPRLETVIADADNISVGSFFYTKLHEVVKNGMDVYDVASLIGFGNVKVLDAILASTGINIPWSIATEDCCPPDPFE